LPGSAADPDEDEVPSVSAVGLALAAINVKTVATARDKSIITKSELSTPWGFENIDSFIHMPGFLSHTIVQLLSTRYANPIGYRHTCHEDFDEKLDTTVTSK
jgi:hypothetical protein